MATIQRALISPTPQPLTAHEAAKRTRHDLPRRHSGTGAAPRVPPACAGTISQLTNVLGA